MLFDTTAPSSSFWTPPKVAQGKDKFLLSLMGYGADGSQNGWGKISSWIPGLNVAANNSAQITARQAGLGDVANAIGSDMDNRMQKLQAGVNVVKGAVGVATANPALIQSGVQGLTQSISGLANAQDDPTQYVRGTTSYQRFAEGGKPKKPNEAAVRRGEQWAKDWFANRPQMQDAEINYDAIPSGEFRSGRAPQDKSAKINGSEMEDGISGYFSAMGGNHIVYNALPQGLMHNAGRAERSGGVHEMTHAIQYANWNPTLDMGDKLSKLGSTAAAMFGGKSYDQAQTDATLRTRLHNDPIADSFDLISKTPKKITDSYLTSPDEVHARIMEWRHATGTKPNEKITPEVFKQRTDAIRGKLDYSSMAGVRQLLDTIDEKHLPGLIDKTAYNGQPEEDGLFRAAEGGTIYPEHDKTSEDIIMYDKASGEKVGEMRYHERIFDQQATQKIDELAGKKDDKGLGRFLRRELATHADKKGGLSRAFAGGGKPEKPTGFIAPPGSNWVDVFNPLTGVIQSVPPTSLSASMGNNIPEVTVSAKRTAATQRPYAMLPEGGASAASLSGMTGRVVAPPVQDTPSAAMSSPAANAAVSTSAKKQGGKLDWWGMGSDALRAVTAAIGAGQPLPTRPVNPNLAQMSRELADRQNEGLSGAERTNLLRQQADQQGRDVQMIRDTVGGGGNANAVLAAVGAASDRSNAMTGQIEGVDRSQRQQNRENYYRDLTNSQAGSDAIFSQQYAQAVQNKGAFAQAMAANLQSMADRSQYNQSYGEGSTYHDLMLQLLKRTGSRRDYADAPVTSLTPKLP